MKDAMYSCTHGTESLPYPLHEIFLKAPSGSAGYQRWFCLPVICTCVVDIPWQNRRDLRNKCAGDSWLFAYACAFFQYTLAGLIPMNVGNQVRGRLSTFCKCLCVLSIRTSLSDPSSVGSQLPGRLLSFHMCLCVLKIHPSWSDSFEFFRYTLVSLIASNVGKQVRSRLLTPRMGPCFLWSCSSRPVFFKFLEYMLANLKPLHNLSMLVAHTVSVCHILCVFWIHSGKSISCDVEEATSAPHCLSMAYIKAISQ